MTEKSLFITTPFIKLSSLLKLSDLASSGGEAKAAVQSGEVLVNGLACTQRGRKIYPGDSISFSEALVRVSSK